jgi:hypothetical protein
MKFRKDFTSEEYAQYLEQAAKTDKYEHDGLESWDVDRGIPEGQEESSELRKRNERTCDAFGKYDPEAIHCPTCVIRKICITKKEQLDGKT